MRWKNGGVRCQSCRSSSDFSWSWEDSSQLDESKVVKSNCFSWLLVQNISPKMFSFFFGSQPASHFENLWRPKVRGVKQKSPMLANRPSFTEDGLLQNCSNILIGHSAMRGITISYHFLVFFLTPLTMAHKLHTLVARSLRARCGATLTLT